MNVEQIARTGHEVNREKLVKMTARLYDCRDTAKRFFGEEFPEKLKPYTDLIQAVMKANNEEEIPALIRISHTRTYQDNPMAQMMFMAAVVELIEPSGEEPIVINRS